MTQTPTETVLAFNRHLNAGEVDAMMVLMTDDCVFENTYPPPDGTRYVGQPEVRAFWEDFLRNARQPHFDFDDIFACEERVVLCWTYHWVDERGLPGHVRGVDLYRVRGGKIAEKLSYVKG